MERRDLRWCANGFVLWPNLVVADIALYHQNEIEALVAGDDRAALDSALQEGRQMLLQVIAQEELGKDGLSSESHC